MIDDNLEELEAIMFELANRYTGGDSTSISYERAKLLMDAVRYCIHEYEMTAEHGYYVRTEMTVRERYAAGRQIVLDKANRLRDIYNHLVPCFNDYGVVCLRDTVVDGIGQFLKRYDAQFAPQETLLTLDYPVLKDISALSGVDAVLEYIRCIEWEQEFLSKFDGNYIRLVLKHYHQDYENLFENICHIITMNLAGHIILHKPLKDMGFLEEELEKICILFSGQTEKETEEYISKLVRILTDRYYPGNLWLYEYLYGNIHAIAIRIRFAVSIHHLEKIFLL